MGIAALVLGVLAAIGMTIAFIPCLGWLNWLNIPFAMIGLIISIIAVSGNSPDKNKGLAGLILCSMAIVLGAFRLMIGGGIF